MNKTKVMAGGFVLALSVAFGIGLYVGVSERLDNTAAAAQLTIDGNTIKFGADTVQPKDLDFAKFWQAWNLLQDNFVETHASSTIPTNRCPPCSAPPRPKTELTSKAFANECSGSMLV